MVPGNLVIVRGSTCIRQWDRPRSGRWRVTGSNPVLWVGYEVVTQRGFLGVVRQLFRTKIGPENGET